METINYVPAEETEAIIIQLDYKANYKRYALTPEEFRNEFSERLAEDMPYPSEEAESYTLRPMVHIWYQKVIVGDDAWIKFFADMEDGLAEGDIRNRNLAYIDESEMKSLSKYVPKAFYELWCSADGLFFSPSYLLTVEKETEKMYYGAVRLDNAKKLSSFVMKKDDENKVIYIQKHNKYRVQIKADSFTEARLAAAKLIHEYVTKEAGDFLEREEMKYRSAIGEL